MQTITEALIARMIQALPGEAATVVAGLSEAERAEVAVFCNARTHLRAHGRTIAATCSRFSLSMAGGAAGAAMLTPEWQEAPDVRAVSYKRPISLARAGGQWSAA